MEVYASFVVMYSKGLLCCTTRPDGKYGSYGLPGGKVEPGENHVDAALRETMEEGWQLPKDYTPYPYLIKERNGKLISYILILSKDRPKKLKEYKEKKRGIKPILRKQSKLYNTVFNNQKALKIGRKLFNYYKNQS